MGEIAVDDVYWKKGELGLQQFEIRDSDGSLRDLTGKTFTFHFWLPADSPVDKGTGSLTLVTPLSGLASYTMVATDSDTVGVYDAELIENPGSDNLKSNTFKVIVEESGP